MKNKLVLPLFCCTLASYFVSENAFAKFSILERNKESHSLLAPLNLEMSGSIRPEWIFNTGKEPNYYKNGHDGGSRLRFKGDYSLSDRTNLVGYYEWGLDIPHLLRWNGHYDDSTKSNWQRQFYGGIEDETYGRLTYGHQWGVYYSVVGVKSDVWDNTGHAAATGIGINGNHDGANRPKNSIMYQNTFGPVKLYANYLLPEYEIDAPGNQRYHRNHGQGIGFDYQATEDVTLSLAHSNVKATIKDRSNKNNSTSYQQQITGTALTWQPSNWYIVGTAGYYKNFVPSTKSQNTGSYFAGSGYGLESFVGYTFKLEKTFLESIQPYIAADTLRLKGEDFHANHLYVGTATEFGYGLSLYVEHTFSSTTDKEPGSTWINVFYEF